MIILDTDQLSVLSDERNSQFAPSNAQVQAADQLTDGVFAVGTADG